MILKNVTEEIAKVFKEFLSETEAVELSDSAIIRKDKFDTIIIIDGSKVGIYNIRLEDDIEDLLEEAADEIVDEYKEKVPYEVYEYVDWDTLTQTTQEDCSIDDEWEYFWANEGVDGYYIKCIYENWCD